MNNFIEIKRARVHNLKNLSVNIPHGKLVVITGVSGSGKSSLAFDTVYAEGQRRFIESMSSYARQFLGKLNKPEADYIKGIAPSIAIQQKVITNNPRSTVGTTTEIYDYLKLLFARIGKTYSPKSGKEVKKHTSTDVINYLKSLPENSKIAVLCPIDCDLKKLDIIYKQGFTRVFYDNQFYLIEDLKELNNSKELYLVVDRISTNFSDEDNLSRATDSVSIAFTEGKGNCGILNENNIEWFNNRFELDDIEFQEPNVHFFAFNNPFGACKTCEGYGMVLGIDEELVFPNRNLSVYEGAIAPWKGDSMGEYLKALTFNAKKFDFPIHRPIKELTKEQLQLLWTGNQYFEGLTSFFKFLETQTYKIQYRVMLSRYRGKTFCPECHGTRLRGDAANVKINGLSIQDVVLLSIEDAHSFFSNLELNEFDRTVSKRILPEIQQRLGFLKDVGLGYLTLNRAANSLSGGESQRINLATSLGSSLVGSVYVLDEPSIGLHPKDTERLITVLQRLKALGNTVIIVEHEEEVMKAADEIIDIGPKAGVFGGEVVFQGDFTQLKDAKNSLTAEYLTEKRVIPVPTKRRKSNNKITIEGARQHNLKNINVSIPLNSLVCITGVSGSGKSTLIRSILYPAVRKELGLSSDLVGKMDGISGDLKQIKNVEFIDQNPIGKSSRSNPITYVKAFDDVRELYSRQPIAKARGYKPGFFSFNVEGGRCEMCEGEGTITVGMQFMADVHLNCDACKGKRYKSETLEVEYRGKTIYDLLETSLEDALQFFKEGKDKLDQKIVDKIQPLVDVGLGYLKVGQSSSTMSGGEAQRIKLASFLSKGTNAPSTLFIFDEPTTGLHFYDIEKLLIAFNALIDQGHSVVVIEHNTEVIKCADYIIDIGPVGGENGGNIQFEGNPEELVKLGENATARFLREKL
ncbi:MAG: excinuclease ABC subunit A [Flavobacteriales bacterium]|nr:excinuclease ABC subunit A [Flavobacteriales bacterium]